jgi:hypothetical protein
MREQKEEREAYTEILTEYILSHLIDSMSHNMFPKRAVIPIKSPSKELIDLELDKATSGT